MSTPRLPAPRSSGAPMIAALMGVVYTTGHPAGDTRIDFGELVTLGAHQKVTQLRASRDDATARRRALAERIRRRDIPVDRAAADEVRRAGWARQ